MAERLTRFNDAFQQASDGILRLRHSLYLPITLDSDLILKDTLFRHIGLLDGKWLSQASGIEGAELVVQAADLHQVTGWNALWGLPRADDWAIAMKSVFLLGLPGALSADQIDRLEELERDGVGLRRAEGFGSLRFADPFHVEVNGI